MTSPSIRRQRTYDRQAIPSPNFGIAPTMPSHTRPAPPMSRHWPVPVDQYPGLPRNDIARHDRSIAFHTRHSSIPSESAIQLPLINWAENLEQGYRQ